MASSLITGSLPPIDLTLTPRLHFIGVCGVGMGAVAVDLADRGWEISGSDHQFYPPMSEYLERSRVKLFYGFNSSQLPREGMIVVGNAISRGNEEIEEALNLNLPLLSLPELISRYYLPGRKSIVVAGTHGKTTITSLITFLLLSLGKSPGWLVGGIPRDLSRPCAYGEGEWFIVEGDEYDSAFFDKRPKFYHYRPYFLIITSIEWDHIDIYPDRERLKESFRRLVRLLPRKGLLVANGDDPAVREVATLSPSPVIFYGTSSYCHWRLTEFKVLPEGQWVGQVAKPNGEEGVITLSIPGEHNLLNALAALALLEEGLGMESDIASPCLLQFTGVRRRLERIASDNGWLVYNDFAHHPTAIQASLAALKKLHPTKRISALFEPRSNSMVRNVFQGPLTEALTLADEVTIGPVYRADKIPPSQRLDREQIVKELSRKGITARWSDDWEEITEWVKKRAETGDVVIMMSNGALGNISTRLKIP